MSVNKRVGSSKQGFTIVEMVVSMAFISFLVVLIGYVTLRISHIYQKGISIRDVNKTADLIISDIQGSVINSGTIKCAIKRKNNVNLDINDDACLKLFDADSGKLDSGQEIVGGAICTGKVSYLWNYGHVLRDIANYTGYEKNLFRYKNETGQLRPIRMARIDDAGGLLCSDQTNPIITSVTGDNPTIPASDLTNLIEYNDRDLALHSVIVTNSVPDDKTGQSLYDIEFVLGTFRQGILMTNDAQCKSLAQAVHGPGEKSDETQLSYCAINKFNFAVRAVAGKGKW